MMFPVDFDIKFVMKKIRPSIRDGSSPYGGAKSLMEWSPLLRGRSWNSIESLIMTVDLYQCIHIDTTPMTLNGIMTLCKHRLGQAGWWFHIPKIVMHLLFVKFHIEDFNDSSRCDTMWGRVMIPFPKRYKKSDALQVQLCWVGAIRPERWDP